MNGRYTFYQTLIVVLTLGGLFLLWQLTEIIVVLLGAVIIASALRPVVSRLTAWRVPQGLAILLLYILALSAIGGLLALALPPLVAVIGELVREGSFIYKLGAILYNWAVQLGYSEVGATVFMRLIDEWNNIGARIQAFAQQEGASVLQQVVQGLSQLLLGLVMSYYWLTARDKIQGLMLSVTPLHHRGRLETIFNDVEHTLGDYVRGTGLLMLAIGVSTFVGLLILRVPHALALALLAGLFEAIPLIGATLGALPAVLVAFTVSPTTGLLTILLFVIIQFLENNVLVPRIHEHSLGLNPLLVIIAIVAGGTLNGIVGALLAIPTAAALQVIVRHLLVEPLIEEASESHDEHGIPIFDVDEAASQQSGILIARS